MSNIGVLFIASSLIVVSVFIALVVIYNIQPKFAANHNKLILFILFCCSSYLFFYSAASGYHNYLGGTSYVWGVIGVIVWLINMLIYGYEFYKKF